MCGSVTETLGKAKELSADNWPEKVLLIVKMSKISQLNLTTLPEKALLIVKMSNISQSNLTILPGQDSSSLPLSLSVSFHVTELCKYNLCHSEKSVCTISRMVTFDLL